MKGKYLFFSKEVPAEYIAEKMIEDCLKVLERENLKGRKGRGKKDDKTKS